MKTILMGIGVLMVIGVAYWIIQYDIRERVFQSANAPTSADTDEEAIQVKNISFGESDPYLLPVPSNWTYEHSTFLGGSVSHARTYIYDENEALVMVITSPIREIGYENMDVEEQGSVKNAMGPLPFTIRIDRDSNSGFAQYAWNGGSDWNRSFEIMVYFRPGLFAKTVDEQQAGRGDRVRFSSLEDFQADRAMIENIIVSIDENPY